MKRVFIATLFTIGLATSLPANADDTDATSEFAARDELHLIQTLTLSDQHFLKGEADGTPVTITGQFRIAQGTGRLPVVLLMHGSGGMGPNIEMWSKEFNAMGFSAFAIDGFTGRGLTTVNTN